MRLEHQEAGGVPWEWAFSSCHITTQSRQSVLYIHNLNSGQSHLFLWERAQVLAWYFLWRSGRGKRRAFSTQNTHRSWVQWRKTDFPSYPAKEPGDIWARFLYLHWENKIRTFQHCSYESTASFIPSSHLGPAGTQKPSLLWKKKALRNDAHRSQLCFCSEKSLSTKTTQAQNSRLSPLEALSPLSHILGSDPDLPFSLQKLTRYKKRARPRVFVTMTQVCAVQVSSAREFLCMAPNHCKTTLTLQDSWHLKHCWAIKFSSLMAGSYSICSH